jgi:thiol-disulfide isomerase/thioredoxin
LVSLNTPLCNFGWKAKPFNLLGVDDKSWTLDKAKGEKGLLIMFICNHCPYVKAILPRLINNLSELNKYGINSIAISSNDVVNYPEDSFEEMKKLSILNNFPTFLMSLNLLPSLMMQFVPQIFLDLIKN